MFVCCLSYCPCLIWGRVLRGTCGTRGSSCRCGASLSGSVLVPVSSKNEAVRVEMKSKAWVTENTHKWITATHYSCFFHWKRVGNCWVLVLCTQVEHTERNTPVWPQPVPLWRCWWRGRNLGQSLSQCRYLVTGVWNSRHPLLEEYTWGKNERWKHPTST